MFTKIILACLFVAVVAAYDCKVCYGDMCCNIPANHEYYLTDFCGSGGTTACGYSCTAYRYFTADRQRFGCNSYLNICARGKCLKAKVIDAGPADWVEDDAGMPIIDSSVPTCEYFTGHSSCGWSDRILITAVPTLVNDESELGPYNVTEEEYRAIVGEGQLAYDRMIAEQEARPAAPAPCCSPNQWEGYQFSWDERRHFRAGLNISYDYTNRRFRILIEERFGDRAERVLETIALYNSKQLYIIDHTTNVCTVRALNDTMEPDCVPANATYEASPSIGGSLKTNVFRFNRTEFGQVVHFIDVRSQDYCLNINTVLADERYGVDINFFWDVAPGIKNPSVFTPPSNCNHPEVEHPLVPQLMKFTQAMASAKFNQKF